MATEDANSNSSVIPKAESFLDSPTPSSESSPPAELDASVTAETATTDPPPIPKRKGGRKPIYATSEERKQRNRQAQAAFRERRTEYIKQLETTIQHHEETLHNLQQSHRTAADECLMLRYKNSLLERILLEKGIDVQAELRLKSSPHLRPIQQGTSVRNPSSNMQKAIMNRQQQARQRPLLTSPVQSVNHSRSGTMSTFSGSPVLQQGPTSQQSSPTALRSPGFSLHSGITSPIGEIQGQPRQNQRPASQMSNNPYAVQSRSHLRTSSMTSGPQSFNQVPRLQQPASMQSGFYPTTFQKHYDQLDQEYDAQAEYDDVDGDDVDVDNFIPNFRLPPTATNGVASMGMQVSPPTTVSAASDAGGGVQTVPLDYDPMLDADPFGLTASMHFPNPYAFPSNHTRR